MSDKNYIWAKFLTFIVPTVGGLSYIIKLGKDVHDLKNQEIHVTEKDCNEYRQACLKFNEELFERDSKSIEKIEKKVDKIYDLLLNERPRN